VQKNRAALAMFGVLLISYMLNAADRSLFSILAVEVRSAMSLSLPEVGLATTVFTLGMGLAGVPTGYLLSFLKRRTVVQLGLLIFSAATFLTAYSHGLPDLLLYRFISGLGEAMQVTAILAIGASYFPKNRALMTGSVSFAYGIGSFVGPVATAKLLAAFDWKMPFIVFGLLGIVAIALVAVGVWSWFSENKGNAGQQAGDEGRIYPAGDSDTIWNPVTVLLALAAVSAGVASYGLAGLYPTYMRSALGFTPQQAAGVMSMIGIGGFLAPLGGWLGDRLGYQRVLMIALPLTGLAGCLAFSELNKSIILHSMVAVLYGVAVLTLLYSNMSAIIISSMKPSMTAKTSGMFIASYYIPAAFAGYLLAQIKEATDWSTAGILQTAGFAFLSMLLIVAAGIKGRPAMAPAKA